MGKQTVGSPTAANRDMRGRPETRAVTPGSNDLGDDQDTARKEMIASVVREWIVPALVRKFLAERVCKAPVASGDEFDALSQTGPFGSA